MKELKKTVWESAVKITGGFEGDGYENVTGNFDGQGLSLGVLQWNFGQGTLQPLFTKLFLEHPDVAKNTLGDGAKDLLIAIKENKAKEFAIHEMNNGHEVKEPWLSSLKKLCGTTEFRGIQDHFMVHYRDTAISMCEKFGMHTDRAFCLFFDIAVQDGGIINQPHFNKSESTIDKMKAIIDAVVGQSNEKFQKDVRSRKECVLNGHGTVHGEKFSFNFLKDEDAFK